VTLPGRTFRAERAVELSDRAVAVLTAALGPGNRELKPFLEDQRTLRKRAGR
jgi:hypothetical protein